MIKTVIKTRGDIVLVFDAEGKQLTRYQGPYEQVKGLILDSAPSGTVFAHGFNEEGIMNEVPRGDW